jgi:hypothetical protein
MDEKMGLINNPIFNFPIDIIKKLCYNKQEMSNKQKC